MNEKNAREILKGAIQGNGKLYDVGGYISWPCRSNEITLDGDFTLEELEAMAWWVRNKTIIEKGSE